MSNRLTTLLLRDTDGTSATTSRLGVLTSDSQSPVMSQTAMTSDLLQSLQIITHFRLQTVSKDLIVLAVDDVVLSVEEPGGDLVGGGVLDDSDDAFELFDCKFSGTFVQVDIGLFADQVGVSTTDTTNLGHGVHDLLLSINVGIEETQDVLKIRFFGVDERHDGRVDDVLR